MTDNRDRVLEMREDGMGWSDIADELGCSRDEAAALWRVARFDHWELGWSMETERGVGHAETGAVELWCDGDHEVGIEELSPTIPLSIANDDGETRLVSQARLTAEQARELARTLDECADHLEEKA